MFLPIAFSGWLLALVIVWPVAHLLSGCGATRSVYQATGTALGAMTGFGLLSAMGLFTNGNFTISGDPVSSLLAPPLAAATMTGLAIADFLWQKAK